MPANLSPEFHRAEERLRAARTPAERIAAIEEMLRVIPRHKGTEGMQGDLRARLAKLRREPQKKGGHAFSHAVPREGAGQVALVGPPNSGKSSLLAALTHAQPEIADYPFTTREAMPGMMAFEDVGFQVLDLPALSAQHLEPWVLDLVRAADLAWIVVDGAVALEGLDEVSRLAAARGLEFVPAPGPASANRLPALLVITGIDRPDVQAGIEALRDLLDPPWPLLAVSASTGAGLDALRRRTFDAFDVIRVYTKQPGKPADRRAPFVLPRGATVADLAMRIHHEVLEAMKFARVWGPSAFDGQVVHRDHVLAEGDVVEIHR
jgi:hypothetical protein